MTTKILVTGGAGYIGSFMVRELASKGFDVTILDNLSCGHKEAVKDFRLEEIDLVSQKDKLDTFLSSEKFDGVVHMASFIQMGESFIDPQKYYQNNVVGFINLLDSMKKAGTNKIILSIFFIRESCFIILVQYILWKYSFKMTANVLQA